MSLPTLAIVVVSYNSGEWLEKCLGSLLENIRDYPAKIEVGLVENGEAAKTFPIVQTFIEQGLLKWLPASQNLGYGGGANFGWQNLKGEICIVLNPDMSFPAGWLSKFVVPFEHDREIGIVGCKLLYANGKVQNAGGIVKYGAALIETFGQGEADDGRWDESGEAEFVTGAALAIRRELIEKLGGFDASFFPGYFEDVDLCYRARQAGYKVWYEGSASAYHYEGQSFGRSLDYYRAFHRNRLRFVLKHYSARRVFEEFLPAERTRLTATTTANDRLAGRAVYRATRRYFLNRAATPGGVFMTADYDLRREETDPTLSELNHHLGEVKARWLVEEKPFRSGLPFVAALRERFNSISTKWYVKPILAQQVEYNAAVSRAIEDLGNIVSGKLIADDLEATALASRLTALEARLERIETLLEKLVAKE